MNLRLDIVVRGFFFGGGGGPKLEKTSTSSSSLPPCLVSGGGIRKLGVKGEVRTETETNHEKRTGDRTQGKDSDPNTEWPENQENEKARTGDREYHERTDCMLSKLSELVGGQ